MRNLVNVLLGMNGVVLGHMTALRWLFIALSLALYFFLREHHLALEAALVYYAIATVAHYVYLGGMFRRRGWSIRVREKFGETQGYLLHESWMAFLFAHNGLSIGFLCDATRDVALGGWAVPGTETTRLIVGGICIAIGLGMKGWATVIVTLNAYYYKDLFLDRFTGKKAVTGPYRWLNDPMYTVGHLHGYGVAIMAGSAWGLLGCAVNQALVLGFNALIEQPHVRRIVETSPAG